MDQNYLLLANFNPLSLNKMNRVIIKVELCTCMCASGLW